VNQRLYRSRDDRVIAGVAGGVADYFGMDPSIVRVVWAVLTLFSGGLLFLLYIVMWIVVPEEPFDWTATSQGMGAPGAPAGPVPPTPIVPPAVVPDGATAPGPTGEPMTEPGATPADAASAGAGAPVPPAATAAWAATAPPPMDPRSARRAERAARRAERRANRDPSGAVIFGLILVLVGAFFLVQTYVPSIDAGRFWPIVLVILGVVLLVASLRPGSGGEPKA
jgi:phage shock protein C